MEHLGGDVDLAGLYRRLSALELREHEIHSESRPHIRKRQIDIANGISNEFASAECATKIGLLLEGLASVHDERGRLRKSINDISRSRIGCTTVLDLPNELLVAIFGHVRDEQLDLNRRELKVENGNCEDIKNIRLTCRRFCETSSHLLMNCVYVDFTTASIVRLTEVSEHPLISRGIRSVQVNVYYYSHRLAADFSAFKSLAMDNLGGARLPLLVYVKHTEQVGVEDDSSREMALSIMSQVGYIIRLWEESSDEIRSFLDTPGDDSYHKLLAETWEQYGRREIKQRQLWEDGNFSRMLASALAKMPLVNRMRIADNTRCFKNDDGALLTRIFTHPDEGASVASVLRSLMLRPTSWGYAWGDELEVPPTEFLTLIPLALSNDGVYLRNFNISVSAPKSFELQVNDSNRHALECAAQHIESFTFAVTHEGGEAWLQPHQIPHELASLLEYISIMMNPRKVETLSLKVPPLAERATPSASLGNLLTAPRSWPELKTIHLDGIPLRLSEFKKFIHKTRCGLQKYDTAGRLILKEERINVALCHLDLITGRWEDLLDILRRCCGFASEVTHHTGWLNSDSEYLRAFIARDMSRPNSNRATAYIRRRIKNNPLRDNSD
ncbi:hypothetical protein BKA67DRAFT_654911 [Truncatella angustata]|uniref:F-box domain-containing protein n=1 Tax=Truncatella angustata TaxID=152316 RepID=A0A9P8ZZU7_9PEZI|nr:uncharacterized protein BKA67DRAFT_654911 [Truncatella angustata]KAH6656583.1 hypothetical protein BKA67DRAFT_654911 [Truncatella angustata]